MEGRYHGSPTVWTPKRPKNNRETPPYDESVWIIVYVLGFYMIVMTFVIAVGLVVRRKALPPDRAAHMRYLNQRTRVSPTWSGAATLPRRTVLTPLGRIAVIA